MIQDKKLTEDVKDMNKFEEEFREFTRILRRIPKELEDFPQFQRGLFVVIPHRLQDGSTKPEPAFNIDTGQPSEQFSKWFWKK